MKLKIRQANVLDKDFLEYGVMRLLSELRGCPVYPEQMNLNDTVTDMILDDENYGIFIAEKDETQIGFMAFAVVKALHCGIYTMIEELWVSEKERNAGVGKLLMEALERYCMEHEIRRIDVGLPGREFPDFNKTNGFYSGCGFTDVGIRKKKVL